MNKMPKNNQEILNSVLNICDVHVKRIESSLKQVKTIFPITVELLLNIDEQNLLNLEMLSSRFSKLQDLIGVKLFSLVLELAGDHADVPTVIDKVNRLEKIGLDINYKTWAKIREIRNHLSHEYPDNPEITAANLNEFNEYVSKLLQIYQNLKAFSLELINKTK